MLMDVHKRDETTHDDVQVTSTVIFLAMTHSHRRDRSDRVIRDTRRIEYMMYKHYNSSNAFVSVSMAHGFENEKTANFLWANFKDSRFYTTLKDHIMSYPDKLSTKISCVILDYVNMPGSYPVENYLGMQTHLLDFFLMLTMKAEDSHLRLLNDGCIYIPLTPSFYEKIEYSQKLKTRNKSYVISFMKRHDMIRHPLVASDLEIEEEISWLDKNVRDSLMVLGRFKNSRKLADNEQVFLLLQMRFLK